MHTTFIGIDGCKAGWAVFQSTNHQVNFSIEADLPSFLRSQTTDTVIMIDMPIGITKIGERGRLCDKLARKFLSPKRSSSVFSVPTRDSLYAENYQDALEINRQQSGVGFSIQTWNICPKIRILDAYLRETPDAPRIYETHPEVCFTALAGSPMRLNKKKTAGFAERMAILQAYQFPGLSVLNNAIQTTVQRRAARDDLVDAFVCLITAMHVDQLDSFPENPPQDEMGLPCRIVYYQPRSLQQRRRD